ncbi:MAG: addiction module protein [Planctomycetia bacterium]|nr:addiction module protein [Planctomycetia bacterium]
MGSEPVQPEDTAVSTRLRDLGIDQLSIVERIALAQEILDSVAAEQPRVPLSEAKRAELDRRVADCAANPSDETAWEEVEAAAMQRFAQ